jgi:transposase
MEIPDHSLPQITPEVLNTLSQDELLRLSIKLVKDLKEARDRLNQNQKNSSRPPSSIAPWEKSDSADEDIGVDPENEIIDLDQAKAKEYDEESKNNASNNEANCNEHNSSDNKKQNKFSLENKKPGKQKGAPGYGRTWTPDVTEEPVQCYLNNCVLCEHLLNPMNNIPYTQYNQVDIQLGNNLNPGLTVTITPYILYDNQCSNCGHENRYDPKSSLIIDAVVWNGTQLSEWRWIGPNLASLIVHLKMDFRLPIRKIQEILNYFGIELSTGVIQKCYEETGAAVSPLEKPLLEALVSESLIHADETIWLEKSKTLWLWIFMTTSVVYLCVGRRTKELLQSVLQGSFAGWLMTDGYGAYRHYAKRLRCWAHLLRKAQGLADSTDAVAIEFGSIVLTFMKTCMQAIYDWRKKLDVPSEKTNILLSVLSAILDEFKQACVKYGGDSIHHEKTKALAKEFLNDWEAIFRILEHPYLPLTNNEAERGLRPWVLLRKICYGSKSAKGTKTFALLASVIQTCHKLKVNSVRFLAEAISCARKGAPISMPSANTA